MGYFKSSLIFVLAALTTANAYYKLIPDGKEVIYDYKAFMNAGTFTPEKYGSAFYLHGKLHVQSSGESVLMKFNDLKYKLYNGEITHDEITQMEDSHFIELTKEMEEIEAPFKIVYDNSGKAKELMTESTEKMFIVNMKKALASVMQLDVEQINVDAFKPHAFHTKESNIYGKSKTFYNVYTEGEDLMVTKMSDMDHSQHMFQYMLRNNFKSHCESAEMESPLTHDSQKTYRITKMDSHPVVQTIESTGGLYYQPFSGKSEAFFIYTNQTMTLDTIQPIAEKFTMKSEHTYKDFTYYMFDIMESAGPVVDITNGRAHYDMPKLMTNTMEMLHEAVEYMEEHHINMKKEMKNAHVFNRIMKTIMHLDYETMEKMMETMMQKTGEKDKKALELFYHFIPHIGSHASSMFILHLAKDKVVKDMIVIEMLQEMPFHTILPNLKYMTEMSGLMTLEGVSKEVKKTAMMCFSTLLHKAMTMHNQLFHSHHDHEHMDMHNYLPEEHSSDKHFPGESAYEKYIISFVDNLKSAEHDEDKIMYLNCLYNTKMDLAMKYMEPLMKGDWFDSNTEFIRQYTLFALHPMAVRNTELLYELYWPVMINEDLGTNLRTVALLFMLERANMNTLINIYWWMQKETNEDVYQFFYSYLHSWSKSNNPCEAEFKRNAIQVLMYMDVPKYYEHTKYWLMDYQDPKYGYSQEFDWFMIHAREEQSFKFTSAHQLWNMDIEDYTYFVHVQGMEGDIFEDFELDLDGPNHMFNYEKLMKIMTNMPMYKDLKIVYSVIKNKQVIILETYDHENIKKLSSHMDFLFGKTFSVKNELMHMNYEVFNKVFIPSEMGFPVMMETLMPLVKSKDMNIMKETTDNKMITYKFDTTIQTCMHSTIGMAFYNPFAAVWQGINRYQSFDEILPIYMDITLNPQQQSMKLSLKMHKEMEKNIFGAKMHFAELTYIRDLMGHAPELLKKSSPDARAYELVTKGKDYHHDYTLRDHDISSTGLHRHFEFFDTAHYISNGSLQHMFSSLASPHHKSYTTPFGYFLMTILNFKSRTIMNPMPGTFGYMDKFTPSIDHPITSIDLTLRLNQEYKPSEFILLPGMKYNARATFALKKDDKAMKTWDVNMMYDMNPGHSIKNLKMYFTRIIPDQKDYKICMEGTKKMTPEGMDGHCTISMSQAADGKCSTDETIVDIKMKGEKSFDQKHDMHPYASCKNYVWSDISNEHEYMCYYDHWSLRKYTYDVKTMHMPSEFKKMVMYWFDWYKSMHTPYHTHLEDHEEKIEDNSFTLEMEYPMHAKVVDVTILTPQHGYNFTGVPLRSWSWMAYHPENTQYPNLFTSMEKSRLIDGCFIDSKSIETMHMKDMLFEMPTEWTLFYGDAETDAKKGIYVKRMEGDKLALKITYKSHYLEIMPKDKEHKYYFVLDGKKLAENQYYHAEDWFHFQWMKNSEEVAIFCQHLGAHIIFDGERMTIDMPKMSLEWHGMCFKSE